MPGGEDFPNEAQHLPNRVVILLHHVGMASLPAAGSVWLCMSWDESQASPASPLLHL